MNESAVEFESASRIHMGLPVRDLERSIAFYRLLLGQEPTKERPRYAKFEVPQPRVNLSLFQSSGPTGPSNPTAHFGIQVKSGAAVREVSERLKAAGAPLRIEDKVACCYAVQNKVWTADPDGNKWEVYVLLSNDSDVLVSPGTTCCGPAAPQATAAQPMARCC